MSQCKIVVTALVNGQWQWRAEAPIDSTLIRRMSKAELDRIAREAVDGVADIVAEPEKAAAKAEPVAPDRKKNR